MNPEDETTETPENTTPEPEAKAETPKPKEPEAKGDKEDDLPSWARDELSRTRREAARYRTERNELRDKLKDAKSADEVTALVAEYEQKHAELTLEISRERVARKHGLPDELAQRLRGSDEKELEADAELLKQFARPSRGGDDPKGGLDPSDALDDFDADKQALAILAQY